MDSVGTLLKNTPQLDRRPITVACQGWRQGSCEFLGQEAGKTFALAGGSPSGAPHRQRWASGAPWYLPYMFLFKGATSFPFLCGGVWQAVSASWWHLLQDRVWQGRLSLWLWED